jgi:multiphosphoryl transfer protein
VTVGIVIASHSDALARGVVELCVQMAPGVVVAPAGGDDHGGIGTSLDKIMAALQEADQGDGAVVLADLGSAEMTAQTAIEFLDTDQAARVRLADAPLVEGALAAVTTAAADTAVDTVLEAAEAAGTAAATGPAGSDAAPTDAEAETIVTLPNPMGLHARPAAQVVAAVRGFDADVVILNEATGERARADSLLALAGLEAAGGTTIRIEARGPDAEPAVSHIAAMAGNGFGEAPGPPPDEAAPQQPEKQDVERGSVLAGIGAAPGLALGPATVPAPPTVALPDRPAEDEETERQRLDDARARAREELETLTREADGNVFVAHLELLDDPALTSAVETGLRTGLDAARAWRQAVDEQERVLESARTAAFAERAADVRDVGRRVLGALAGGGHRRGPLVPAGAVVVADSVVPSDVPVLADSGAAALVLGRGGRTGHVAVLARGLGLPVVTGLGPAVSRIPAGVLLRVDGEEGSVLVDPDPDEQDRTLAKIQRDRDAKEAARAAAGEPGHTADGTRVTVGANVASVSEAEAAVANGAEGVGLLRTEFLFTDRTSLPTESAQVAELSSICKAMQGRPLIIRTLDVGGDKAVPSLDLDPVRNGFLGVRGLRLSLTHPGLFRTQLRALLRVAATHRISVMFPMVTTVDEVREARRMLDEARASLDTDGVPTGDFEEVGIMVEVPAAALDAASFTDDVDFFSVGTNDLTAYTMAADRTLAEIADLYRPDHPAVLTLIGGLCEAANAAGRWVGVCGELAGDPAMAGELVRLGVRELSMAPTAIPAVKARLRQVDLRPNAR